jgi:hypothetical protein
MTWLRREGEPRRRWDVATMTGIRAGTKGPAMSTQGHADDRRDKALKDSFPASDPPANSGITGAETPDKHSGERTEAEIPTGHPTSDRHATETAHHREDEVATPAKR